ncbi:MAG: CoA pyrophosphatase [Proteobacteria bacterium]|nr:CoA pyrophosphatase [Pseudomonadota bacterium]
MSLLSLEVLRAALDAQKLDRRVFEPNATHASVAMILTRRDGDLEVCFIRRAEREGDPWSGQVAFPGGRASPLDKSPAHVAERETSEEVGLDINESERIGSLPQRVIERKDLKGNLTLSPIVYYIESKKAEKAIALQKAEVAHVFWVPLSHLFNEDFVTEIEYPMGGQLRNFPGITHYGEVIWGLTLRVLQSFSEAVGVPMPATC